VLKRVLVSLIAGVMLFGCYAGYAYLFGRLNLQPLPQSLIPKDSLTGDLPSNNTSISNHSREMARRVWGDDAWQAGDDVVTLYWLQSGVIVYIKDYEKETDDTWRLEPFSLIYTEAPKTPGGNSQIVTMEGKQATLIFDRPVDLIRMSGARPIGGKISGNVQIQADRGTENTGDDFVAYADELQFQESEKRVWTDSSLRLVSGADAVMTGTGGEMHLKFTDPGQGGRETPQFEGATDLVLFHNVQVNMLAAASDGLASTARPPGATKSKSDKPKSDKAPSQDPMPVQITCNGPFRYDVEKTEARFNNTVEMERQTGESQFDRLFSDELVVIFEKNPTNSESLTGGADPSPENAPFQFRQAHATGRSVRILSDGQSIEAIGREMIYDATTGHALLRGEPDVVAVKDGSVLHGRELKFTAGEAGQQVAEAMGAGSLEARNPAGEVQLVARWSDWARMGPQGDQGKLQLLTMQGDAKVDQPGKGAFQADRLKVWLMPNPSAAPSEAPASPIDAGNWIPTRIEGVGHVAVDSDQFAIKASSRLDMTFEDAPPPEIGVPGTDPTGRSIDPRAKRVGNQKAASASAGDSASPAKSNAPKPMSHLNAELVRIKAIRVGDRTDVSEVETEGHVEFEQPPAEPGGDAILVRGDTLNLKRVLDKYYLQVTGRTAHVELNTMRVDGDRVSIDQPTGTAWVDGKGQMVIVSDTSFDGKKLAAPSEMTISWGSRMFFDGLEAEFGGGVEAQQGENRLKCQSLVAKLTERMDIAAPKKREASGAKIRELICTNAVVLDNYEFANERLEKYEHLECIRLDFSNESGQMTATGPGFVRSYMRGSAELAPGPGAAPAKAPAAKPAKNDADKLILTEVHFEERLTADRVQQIANFKGHVELVRAPVNDITDLLNPDSLGPNGMRIASEQLEMGTKRGPEDRPYNVMVAEKKVSVESDVFHGVGDRVSYNQLLERIIFESLRGSPATFYRVTKRGVEPDMTSAFKIIYFIREDRVKVEGATTIDLREREADVKNHQKTPTKRN
jgi:hypothetical protein